jgi:hypothetical protein
VRTQADVEHWLVTFQGAINNIAGNDKLLFTAEVWTTGEEGTTMVGEKVGTEAADQYPFLDMELSWDEEGILKFRVHMKPNQQLKYLNTGSAHTPGCFKAIMTRVCYCLTKLTTVDKNNEDMKLDEIYPEHFGTLNKADLLKNFEAGLTKLTTVNENNEDMELDEIYPEHFGTLNKADVLKNFEAPTLQAKAAALEAASRDEVKQATKKRRERDRK